MNKPSSTPCVEWTGTRHRQGYGRLQREGKLLLAHRVAYCDSHGVSIESIAGKVVRHKCDNTACVNPDHLELGTQRDNVHDCEKRGRARHPAGGENGRAKLTADQVREIRRLAPQVGCRKLRERFGIASSTLSAILSGATWKTA